MPVLPNPVLPNPVPTNPALPNPVPPNPVSPNPVPLNPVRFVTFREKEIMVQQMSGKCHFDDNDSDIDGELSSIV